MASRRQAAHAILQARLSAQSTKAAEDLRGTIDTYQRESSRQTNWLLRLTWAIAILTVFLCLQQRQHQLKFRHRTYVRYRMDCKIALILASPSSRRILVAHRPTARRKLESANIRCASQSDKDGRAN
jgi:hypothetical protein